MPSQGHHERGTPYSASGSTTHFAWLKTEKAENPAMAAPAMLTIR